MKILVRAFVAVLVLTGAAASTKISSASTQNKVVASRVSVLPIPSCAPDDPNACGLGSTQ
jgi:outer membrane murein-binding lipoprotein Lpp